LVDQIVVRLLPVDDPRFLVQLKLEGVREGSQSGDGLPTFPHPLYLAFRDRNTVFAGLIGQRIETASLVGAEPSELVRAGLVAGNFFAVLATPLSAVGRHGVLAFVVARRTREIGIRITLGAERGAVVRLVAGGMFLVVVSGIALGVAAALVGGRYVQSQLFGEQAGDPLVFAATVGALAAVAALATLLPAWRASRIEPTRALRHE
jgi:ABC-type antimicrobial peptide transport system permease subunit